MSDRRLEPAEDLNLVPIMNLVTILIPFLLMAAQFVALAVVDSAVPAIADDVSKMVTPGDDKLRLDVFITDKGYAVAGSGKQLGIDTDDDGRVYVPCSGDCVGYEDYDSKGLTSVLADVKDVHPDHIEVVLVPEDRINYDVLIAAMDATRADGDRELFPAVVIAGAER